MVLGPLERRERVQRARQLLEDELLKEALAELERRAVEDFLTSARWWWGDRRRRIAAEHLREARAFRQRLTQVLLEAPPERIQGIA